MTHPAKTPGQIWKDAVKKGSHNVPKLRISSAAMRLARNIGKQFSCSTVSVSSIDKDCASSSTASSNVSDGD